MTVLKRPTPSSTEGKEDLEFGFAVKKYHNVTSANLGPEVIAMNSWKKDRSGYRSPIVAETDGNHSSGYPYGIC
jgi:hypothetical protein